MEVVSAQAYAKVNFVLDIVGRRRDDYHEIDTVFHQLEWSEPIRIHPARRWRARLCPQRIAPAGNTLERAQRCYERWVGPALPVHVAVKKGLPAGSGLGGGSADAGTWLTWQAKQAGIDVGDPRLQQAAVATGADVPFFLSGAICARAGGIGEKIEPLPGVEAALLVAVPGLRLSSAAVYQRYDAIGGDRIDVSAWLAGQKSGDLCQMGRSMGNALQRAALSLAPVLAEVEKALWALHPLGVTMTGSGSAFFALFADRQCALAAAEKWQLPTVPIHVVSLRTV
ncbi:MAG: hypothetical protein IMW91_04065 [Firmicutes bacterium]|nr:hypothetical protein [Bacillota bacterium]